MADREGSVGSGDGKTPADDARKTEDARRDGADARPRPTLSARNVRIAPVPPASGPAPTSGDGKPSRLRLSASTARVPPTGRREPRLVNIRPVPSQPAGADAASQAPRERMTPRHEPRLVETPPPAAKAPPPRTEAPSPPPPEPEAPPQEVPEPVAERPAAARPPEPEPEPHSADDSTTLSDRRNTRAQRRRTLLSAKIVYNESQSVQNCTVRDLSTTGAKLVFSIVPNCPRVFDLILSSGVVRRCEVAYRRENSLGVRFLGVHAA